MSRLGDFIHGGPIEPSDVARVRDVVLFEPPRRQQRLVRFWILLTLASAIASYGLIGDSVATVIGAMIVAPLMLPIMGLAFGISIGDRSAIVSSLIVSLGGIATAIAVGWLLGYLLPSSFDPTTNGQIMARTAPRLVDLMAALATGLAGAFATGRKDVSDTLPGVAIAISLVPPLANVGILLSNGQPDLAMGSLLLFVTNYCAILLTGAFVFGLMGYPQASHVGRSLRARRASVVLVIAMVVLVVAPLAVNSIDVYKNSVAEGRAADATKEWLQGSEYRYVSAQVQQDSTLQVVVTGGGALPPESSLRALLQGRVFGLDVRLNAVPSQAYEFPTG